MINLHKNNQGHLHRIDGPARISGGNKEWFINGERHRVNNPAIEWSGGATEWYYNDKKHRYYGSARTVLRFKEWWIHGILVGHNNDHS